ncbi:Transcriptional regulator containing PAS, AAA-type ATPase, and DNA-binding Fis domains [Propionispira arboris]|uniref:Transcriptional regulator containing PAS, AAA-type ATPase, and DNA-binding Fis domains n=1 Tax=Propionispira arboris TaxID=84035 RepID=A0A1H7C9N3_9FIRM|nr:sigma 54-interacting transcriptional regulator [Propionispira arboris]SEJ86573.1 Transcriptional regulator containing PAS, AAA-type ATPase, and DNA-binding Fis domains [Propionispira arboris]
MKSLVVIAIGKNTALACREQLHRLLGNQVNVSHYYAEGSLPHNIKADLILFASQLAYRRTKPYVNKTCPILIARRSINYHEVNKLFQISAGTDVLLVNDSLASANQTIALLQTLGIDHINYYPFAQGLISYPRLKIAVTPGEKERVPDFVDEIIDIKARLIDITTLVELLLQLRLLDLYAEFLSANYMQDILQLIKNGNQMIYESNKMKTQLETILNTVHDGIIATDEMRQISVFNPIAEKLLHVQAQNALHSPIDKITNPNILQIFQEKMNSQEALLKVNGHHLLVTVSTLYPETNDNSKVYTFKDVSEIRRLEESVRRKLLQEHNVARYTFAQIVGQSKKIRQTLEIAKKMSHSDSTILIQGESGTGKELLAQSIHNASPRHAGPFIAVNFAALTENLLESELFGYTEGAFTGANKGGSSGLFEAAHKGTIFLDEIGDAPLPFQVKLLRVLQEQQIRRVGSSNLIPIDVRVIVATNQDLKPLIKKGLFRQDLYYRLNVLPIKIPPLRERVDDILLLCKVFYQNYTHSKDSNQATMYFQYIAPYLLKYNWPGNIRELQNIVEYLLNICQNKPPHFTDLPEELQSSCNFKPSAAKNKNQLKASICQEIKQANQENRSIGRRSLAQNLIIPENQVRVLLEELAKETWIISQKGRSGLKINPLYENKQYHTPDSCDKI